MKKYLSLLAFATIGFASAVNAQVSSLTSTAYPANTSDTVVNTATKSLASAAVRTAKSVVVVFNAAKISGTVGGTATLEASIDGVNWYSYYNSKDSTYSYTLTDVAAQTFRWDVPQSNDQYYRVKVAGTGTMSARITAKIMTKQ